MTTRAVIATEFWHGANGRSLAQGFRGLGWLVDEVEMREFLPRGTTFAARLSSRLLQAMHQREYNRAILESAERHRASVFVTVKGGFVTLDTLEELRARGVTTLNYYPDVEFEHGGLSRELLAGFDVIATTKDFHLDYLHGLPGKHRIALVQHGYSPLAHRPVPPEGGVQDIDILYVGNASPYKRDWLVRVAEAFGDRRIRVVGHRWRALAAGTALAGMVDEHGLAGDFYSELIGRSRINLAVHSGPVRTPGWEDSVSTRTFEIPACGGFMLHIDNPQVRALFDVPREIDTFATPDEMLAKIAHYLDHDAERRAIAEQGHRRAVPAYSMDARAREIAALLEPAAPRSS